MDNGDAIMVTHHPYFPKDIQKCQSDTMPTRTYPLRSPGVVLDRFILVPSAMKFPQEISLKEDVTQTSGGWFKKYEAIRRTVIEVWIRDMYVPELSPTSMFLSVVRCFSPVVGDLETLTLQARSTKRNGAPQRRFGKACQGLLLKSPAVGRSWNHLKMVVDLRYQDTPQIAWFNLNLYRNI